MCNILTNAQDAAVVNGVTSLAHTMGLTAVAKGVEEAEQLAYLCDLPRDQIQGYYMSRPIPSEEARVLLANPVRVQTLVNDAKGDQSTRNSGAQFLRLISELDTAGAD